MGYLKSLGNKRVALSKLHAEGPQILGAIVQNPQPRRYGARDLCTSVIHLLT